MPGIDDLDILRILRIKRILFGWWNQWPRAINFYRVMAMTLIVVCTLKIVFSFTARLKAKLLTWFVWSDFTAKPGFGQLLESGPIRIHDGVRTDRPVKQTNKQTNTFLGTICSKCWANFAAYSSKGNTETQLKAFLWKRILTKSTMFYLSRY